MSYIGRAKDLLSHSLARITVSGVYIAEELFTMSP